MSTLTSRSKLQYTAATFDDMINQFGVVTVMNAKVYDEPLLELVTAGCPVEDSHKMATSLEDIADLKAHEIAKYILASQKDYVTIDSLKIANINVEGPSKTVTGGQYANPLIKFGKTATIEMQDALGRANVLEVLGGAVVEQFDTDQDGIAAGRQKVMHITNDFVGPTTIIGDSFFIDQKTGDQVPVTILLYQVLPDAIFNLTQDSEGDATVFDLNGSLLATTITIGVDGVLANDLQRGVFYSILPKIKYEAKTYSVTYDVVTSQNTESNAADNITEVLAALNAFGPQPNSGGDYRVPELTGYSFYKDAAESGSLEPNTLIKLEQAETTIYIKLDTPKDVA